MSYYYNYYIGYINPDDNKIYPLGPYNSSGRLCRVISDSRSVASDLYEDFYAVKETQISDSLRKEFEAENWEGEPVVEVKYLPVEELPNNSYIKTGYYLIDEVKVYESIKDDEWFEGFSEIISASVYAAMLKNEIVFGKNKPELDCEGNECTVPSASDYMYYAYPDYSSKEYDAHLLRRAVDSLEYYDLPSGTKYVILEDEG